MDGSQRAPWRGRWVGPLTGGARLNLSRIGFSLAVALTLVLTPLLGTQHRASASNWSPPDTVYIPETGQTINGLFLDLWRQGGGYNAYGDPITPEQTQANGHVVQYYQYARFEYWPEGDVNGNTVLLGNIGEELRPVTVRRSPGSTINTKDNRSAKSEASSAAAELIAQTRAWLPLPADKAGTDSATYRYVAESGHSVSNGFKTFWENSGEDAYLGNPLTEEYQLAGTTYQVFERGQLAWKQGQDPYMVPVGQILADRYKLPQEPVGQGDIPTYDESLFIPPPEPVLPALDPNAPKRIDVDLTNQYMRAYQGDVVVIESYVSTGRDPDFTTPAGTFYINDKIESQTMEGVLGGEYYNVPDVPWVMYFTDRGHALHGTYWHSNFGVEMSHGCVNLPMDVAQFLYNWADVGTEVDIHY